VVVIAGHIGVEVVPEAFDPVVVGAVRRKEVELNAFESSQCIVGLIILVNAIPGWTRVSMVQWRTLQNLINDPDEVVGCFCFPIVGSSIEEPFASIGLKPTSPS
jgi:hypothetical protein